MYSSSSSSINSSTENNVLSICLRLLFLGILYRVDRVEAFVVPNTHNAHSGSSIIDSSSSSSPPSKLLNNVIPQNRFAVIDTRRMATVDRDSMTSSAKSNSNSNSKNTGMGKQKVLFQKVIRPTQNMPDVLFLGYLIEYLERHFQLPPNLPMIYENMVIDDDDDDDDDGYGAEQQNEGNRYTLAWDSPLSPSAEATRMEVEVVGIYTDDHKNKDSSSSTTKTTTPSVPSMAMVVVRRANNNDDDKKNQKAIPPMMKGLFDDSEKRIIQALDRGLDDFVAGRIKFDMDDAQAEQRTQDDSNSQNYIPPNVKTAQEAIEAELVDDYPKQKDNSNQVPAEDVVFDAYATTDMGDDNDDESAKNTENAQKKKKTKTKQEVADAKARAMATMQKPADEISKKEPKKDSVSDFTNSDNNTSADFAVEAAKKAAGVTKKKNANTNKNINNKKKIIATSNESAADTVDFAVAAARKAAAMRKKKQSSSSAKESKERVTKSSNKLKSKSVRGMPEVISSEVREPEMTEGPSMPPVPEGWKPRDYFKDQRVFSGTISRPKTELKKTKRKVATVAKKSGPPPRRASAVAAKISSQSETAVPKSQSKSKSKPESADPKTVLNESSIGKRKLNAKVVDGPETDFAADPADPLPELSTSNDKNTPSQEEIEREIMKASKTAMDEIEAQGLDMTPEEMLKDILKFDEEKKKEEQPGSGFVSGAFEKAKELMKDRHRQIQEQKQVGFNEVEKTNSNSFPQQPNPVDPSGEKNRELTPEEELRAMFAAGQKIADGKITSNTDVNDVGSLKATGTTEEDVDRLIAEEKTVSKYGRILDDELAELEVRINSSPGEELDGPQQNPLFDVMSGPEVYNPNVELDAVNYPGAIPGTTDVKLPKDLNEAIKQAEFAASVLMNMETKETKDESTRQTNVKYYSGKTEISTKQMENLQTVVAEAAKSGIIDDPLDVMAERSRLQLILDELWNQPEERFHEIVSSYKDLLLSDRFVGLIRERLTVMADRDLDALRQDDESLREPHERERFILGQLVVYAQGLLKEIRALGAELEAHQLEVVRSICKVAMDPAHTTEEETANALSDAVRDMRPLLDDAFVAYLKYAVAEEEARLARAGILDDPDYNQWLFVLKIVQQGVYAEIAKGINRYVDHIGYVLRMNTPQQRRRLLENLIDDMPTMDVRPFVQVVDNIVGSLGDGVNGNFDEVVTLGEMTNTLLQLQHDVRELLPPERIAEKSRDADEWAARQKKRLMEHRKIGEQRLQAAKEVGHLENDVDAMFGDSGEVDVFD